MLPSLRIQLVMWKRIAWRTRLQTNVSSREQSIRTGLPPICVQHQAHSGSYSASCLFPKPPPMYGLMI